jgi:hypothetical protein
MTKDEWPELPFEKYRDTYETLHLWTQMVGKIKLKLNPWINHSWHIPLYVTSSGLTTRLLRSGDIDFSIDLNFVDHTLVITTCEGETRRIELRPRTVADLYSTLFSTLDELGIQLRIYTTPSELVDPIPFDKDTVHNSYDPAAANALWRAIVQADRVFTEFRSRFIGKCSPVHFFWGSFDLAVTRFSGRRAPEHPGGVPNLPDWVAREAYSHEVSSAGFWPGNSAFPQAAFYSYAYPAPDGFGEASVRPAEAYFVRDLGEFILPYDAVRTARDPDAALIEFLQSTYEAAADLGKWDRPQLERREDEGGKVGI